MEKIAARLITRALDATLAASVVLELPTSTASPVLHMRLLLPTALVSAIATGLVTTVEPAPSSEVSATKSATDVQEPPLSSVYNVSATRMSTTSDSASVTTIITEMTVPHSSKTADINQSVIPNV